MKNEPIIRKINEEKVGKLVLHVRFDETDRMGIVHNSKYLVYYDIARESLLRKAKIHFLNDVEKCGGQIAIVEHHAKYLKPAKFGDTVTIYTALKTQTSVKSEFIYELYVGEQLIHKGETKIAWIDENLKLMNISKKLPEVYNKLKKYVITEEDIDGVK
ncbi:MAG: acyl-CoA thioesterase [Clostridium sp.]